MTGVLRDDWSHVRMMHSADGIALAEVSGVFVAIWRAPASRSLFDWQKFCMDDCVKRHPRGTAFLCVIEPTSRPPDDELRRASADMIGEHEAQLRCVGVVIEGQGFRAAITRGVLSGMVLLLPNRKVPVSYLSSVAEAAQWMGGHIPIHSPQAFTAGVGRVRSQLSAWSNTQL